MASSQPGIPKGPPAKSRLSGKKQKPNYVQIHAKPLPFDVYPLPSFHPSHPLSILQLVWVWASQTIWPPSSHTLPTYVGYFSSRTRSIHIVDPENVRALWEMGFFGKGLLSRSEPSWLEREKARLEATRQGGGTAEEWTAARREERRRFKLERAREEREKIEKQRALEQGQLNDELSESRNYKEDSTSASQTTIDAAQSTREPGISIEAILGNGTTPSDLAKAISTPVAVSANTDTDLATTTGINEQNVGQSIELSLENTPINTYDIASLKAHRNIDNLELELRDREHLQLSLEEAFFLVYALGVLTIYVERHAHESGPTAVPSSRQRAQQMTYKTSELLDIFMRHSQYPPQEGCFRAAPDNPFLLNYVAYHHFRSRGWVVRPGVKFSCDFLLYNRGPVFSHAEYAVMIIPSYSDPYWETEMGKKTKGSRGLRNWWWLHCVNRVQSQVKKTLVLTYIEIPPPFEASDYDLADKSDQSKSFKDIGRLLGSYRVREFTIRRWLPNRSRD